MVTGVGSQPTMQSRLWAVLKIGLALVLAGFVLRQTSVTELVELWQRLSLIWLLPAILSFWAIIWLNARRYCLLLDGKATFRQILALVVLQTALGNLIATSAGAVSYVGILRRKYEVQVSRGVSSLLLARFGDMISLMLALALSSTFVWFQVKSLRILVVLLLLAMLGVVVAFVFVLALRQRIVGLIERLVELLRLNQLGFIKRVVSALSELAEQDTDYLRRLLGPLLAYSLCSLTLSFAHAYAVVQLLAIPLGLWQVVFTVALMQFMTLIPIQVFGGLGVSDVTSLYLYGLFGLGQSAVTPAIIGSRILFYLINLLLLFYFPLESRLLPIQKMNSLAALEGQTRSSSPTKLN
jgi:uncharacterized protein (TIRG00374 family)